MRIRTEKRKEYAEANSWTALKPKYVKTLEELL